MDFAITIFSIFKRTLLGKPHMDQWKIKQCVSKTVVITSAFLNSLDFAGFRFMCDQLPPERLPQHCLHQRLRSFRRRRHFTLNRIRTLK